MPKVAIFASGAGSNAEQILRFLTEKESEVSIQTIICNKSTAGVVNIAKQYNVPVKMVSNQEVKEATALVSFLKKNEVEWIVLAGFLRKIELPVVRAFENRIINLHPSLLPKYGGKGMYGKYVHKAVLDAEETESGISIHLVNEEFDKGEILFQAKCQVEKGQTVDELAKNIQKLEHQYFPLVVENVILEKSADL